MDAAIDVARDEGAAHLSLGTDEDDVAARHLREPGHPIVKIA
jgi:hypothetical protein